MAAHCENGSTAGLLRFNGIRLSEPMVFGIGSGCFFSYMPFIHVNGQPVISFRHWPGMIFKRCTSHLGIEVQRMKFSSVAEASNMLNRKLKQGVPVGLLVGVYHLVYFPPEYRFHFNAHNLVVTGFENDRYQISDPVMEQFELLTKAELERVRFSKGTYPPKGRMYWIESVPATVDLKAAIRKGIIQNCRDMLHIPVPLFGNNGLRFIASRLKNWDKRFGHDKAALRLGMFIRMLEEIGTGGAGFRFMYAAFLQEVSEFLNLPWFLELSEQMTLIGDQWRDFASKGAKNLRNRGVPPASYKGLAEQLVKIAEQEKSIFRHLEKWAS